MFAGERTQRRRAWRRWRGHLVRRGVSRSLRGLTFRERRLRYGQGLLRRWHREWQAASRLDAVADSFACGRRHARLEHTLLTWRRHAEPYALLMRVHAAAVRQLRVRKLTHGWTAWTSTHQSQTLAATWTAHACRHHFEARARAALLALRHMASSAYAGTLMATRGAFEGRRRHLGHAFKGLKDHATETARTERRRRSRWDGRTVAAIGRHALRLRYRWYIWHGTFRRGQEGRRMEAARIVQLWLEAAVKDCCRSTVMRSLNSVTL